MVREKKTVHRVQMTEGKHYSSALEGYDIQFVEDMRVQTKFWTTIGIRKN